MKRLEIEAMPAIRTFARPVNDMVTLSIPREYRSYSFEIMLVPVREQNATFPAWAGLCESAITKNGKPYDKLYITHSDLLAGGKLEFQMASSPNKSRGVKTGKPYSLSD